MTVETEHTEGKTEPRFKTVEEAQAALEASESKIKDLSDSISKLTRVVEMMQSTPVEKHEAPKKEEFVPLIPKELEDQLDEPVKQALQIIAKTTEDRAYERAVTDVAKAVTKNETAEREWKTFVKENPDLEEHADLVRAAAIDYRQEHGNTRLDLTDMRKQVAVKVRTKIEAIRSSGGMKKPIRVETGTETERGPRIVRANEEEAAPSEADVVNTYIKDFQARKQKRLGLNS